MDDWMNAWKWVGVLMGCLCCSLAQDSVTPKTDSTMQLEQKLTELEGIDRVPVLLDLSQANLKTAPDVALMVAEEARRISREAGDLDSEAKAAYVQGNALAAQGKTTQAKTAFREGAQLAESAGNAIEQNKLLEALGRAHYFDNEIEEAIEAFEKALETAQKAGDDVGTAGSMNSLANVHKQLGNTDRSLEFYQGALKMARRLGRMDGVIACLGGVADIHRIRGRYDEAIACYTESLKIAEKSQDVSAVALVLHNLAKISVIRGEYEIALEHLLRSNEMYEKQKNWRYLGKGLTVLAMIYRKTGELDLALQTYQKSLEIAQELNIQDDILTALHGMAGIEFKRKNYAAAIEIFRDELDVLEKHGVKRDMLRALGALGVAYLQNGQAMQAVEVFQRQLAMAEEMGGKNSQTTAHLRLSEAYDALGQYQKALKHHRQFVQIQNETFHENSEKRIAEVRTQYDVEKKEQEAVALKRENQISALTIERQRLTMIVVLSISTLAFIVILFLGQRLFVLVRRWRASRHIAHYRLEEQAGRGGSGVVYRAINMVNRQVVALKVIDGDLVDKTGRQRFIQEGLLAETVSHPNVVQIFDRGEHNDQLYFAMEWLEGQTLRQLNDAVRPDRKTSLCLFSVLVDIVHELHEQGVIHRDLKPANIMILNTWSAKFLSKLDDPTEEIARHIRILDFGLAKIIGSKTITHAASFSGTLQYMAPENLFGQKIRDQSADWYSLAVILYELLTGRQPFGVEEPTEIIRAILTEEPKSLVELDPSIPKDLSDFVLAMLQKDPTKRLSTYDAIQQRLDMQACRAGVPPAPRNAGDK